MFGMSAKCGILQSNPVWHLTKGSKKCSKKCDNLQVNLPGLLRLMRADFGPAPIPLALDRPKAPDDVRARWRTAFAWANRCNAIEGLEPSPLGLQVQEWVADGKLTVEEAVAMLVRHYTGRSQA